MTDAELKTLGPKGSVAALYEKLGSDLTDWQRESVVAAPEVNKDEENDQ